MMPIHPSYASIAKGVTAAQAVATPRYAQLHRFRALRRPRRHQGRRRQDPHENDRCFRLRGRAALYTMEVGQLFVNMLYPAIGEMKSQLEAEYADANDAELMRSLVHQHAEKTM